MTSHFLRELRHRQSDPAGRRWVFVPYDQLSDAIGLLGRMDPSDLGVVMVENRWKARRRPYHKQKLGWVLANGRQFALEQAARGVAVQYLAADAPYRHALTPVVRELGPLWMMEPAERELRSDLAPLVDAGAIEVGPHEGWLTTAEQFRASQKDGSPWRMDAFYRKVRQDTGVLMASGKPVGGKYSFDAENRRRWPGEPAAPVPPTFEPDAVTLEVVDLIERDFGDHPGELDGCTVAATRDDASRAWAWAVREALPYFGPFEDAMSVRSRTLFHTLVSPLLNLGRLLPQALIDDALALDIPLPCREGFVRQVLGWREFMRHVHHESDGFRTLPTGTAVRKRAGDGGYARWRGRPWEGCTSDDAVDGGAAPSALDSHAHVPPAFWGAESGLACLDHVVRDVWRYGYGHHITRLMVLSNLATLLDLEPRDVTDWFWAAYVDAYDWVVEPNVLGMGTFATGELVTTKPYVSGAAYINKMSDYCDQCRFDPKRTCPITSLYWAFLNRHREQLAGVHRMRLPLASAAKRSASAKQGDDAVFERVRAALARGDVLMPDG
jgi:deoxyribodipyrimidine photolyase-related protein